MELVMKRTHKKKTDFGFILYFFWSLELLKAVKFQKQLLFALKCRRSAPTDLRSGLTKKKKFATMPFCVKRQKNLTAEEAECHRLYPCWKKATSVNKQLAISAPLGWQSWVWSKAVRSACSEVQYGWGHYISLTLHLLLILNACPPLNTEAILQKHIYRCSYDRL